MKLPYPLRATKISISFNPFGFWPVPQFVHKRNLTERARADGETIWWVRWLWLQVSYGRWV